MAIDMGAKYQMAKQGTQYSEKGWGLAWPLGGPPQARKLPQKLSTELTQRLNDGFIVRARGNAVARGDDEDDERGRPRVRVMSSTELRRERGEGFRPAGPGPVPDDEPRPSTRGPRGAAAKKTTEPKPRATTPASDAEDTPSSEAT